MQNPYSSIIPLIKLKSSFTDYKKFHQEVNKTFHNVEAAYYDNLHQEMWLDLPDQLRLLINDLLPAKPEILQGAYSLLDLGCGTGLATHLLLQTPLGMYIKGITLLDTSPVMLACALKRSQQWHKTTRLFEGEVADLEGRFDIIIISSVLHHIPDLASFLDAVSLKLNKGGILITIHDPFQEAIASAVYKKRCGEYHDVTARKQNKMVTRVYRAVKRRVFPVKNPDYIGQANLILLENKIIHTPLTEVEMWSITDIHVEGLPYSSGAGISLNWLQQQLKQFRFINYRTYGFFGLMRFQLDKTYREKERRLVSSGDKYGRNLGSIWLKN